MRVSDRWMYERDSGAMQRSRARDLEASDEVSSGTRVNHPWDDPAAAGLGAQHDASARRLDAVSATIDRSSTEVSSMDSGLGDLTELLTRGHELAVQLSNDSYSAGERAGAAAEVTGLFASAVATLNRQVDGRYVFGGFKDGAPPFDASGNYLGDTGVRQVEVGPGVWQNVSVRADVAVKGTGGGVDVLSALTSLSTALAANDTTNLRAAIDTLSTALTQVSQARSQLGTQQNVLDVASTALKQARDGETKAKSAELDADPFDAATRMAAAERALEASIEVASRSGKLTLLGKL